MVLDNLDELRSELAEGEAHANAPDTVRELARLNARLDELHATLNRDPAGQRLPVAPPVAPLGEQGSE